MSTLEEITTRHCEMCDQDIPTDEIDLTDVAYECGTCGEIFTKNANGSHKCGSCGKFASRLDGWVCPECESNNETDDETRFRCTICEEIFETETDHDCTEE